MYDPTAVLAGKPLKQAANALVDVQYGPQQAALKRAAATGQTQGTALVSNAGGYYRQLAQQQAGALAQQDAIGRTLQQRLAASSSQAQQAMAAAAARGQQAMGQDAAVRGAGLSGGAEDQLAQEGAAQQGLLALQSQNQQGLAAETTANYAGLSDLTNRATAARGGEIKQQLLTRLANQQADYRAQGQALAGQEGAARSQDLTQLRQSGFENLVALRGLGIKAAQIQADARQAQGAERLANRRLTATERENRRAARLQRRQQNITRRGQDVSSQTQRRGQDISSQTQRRGQDLSAEQRAADRRSRQRIAKLKARGMSTDAAKQRVSIDENRTFIQTDPKTQRAVKNNNFEAVRHRLIGKPGATPLSVEAAIELERFGYLRPDTAAALRRAGVKLPRGWRRTGAQAYQGPH